MSVKIETSPNNTVKSVVKGLKRQDSGGRHHVGITDYSQRTDWTWPYPEKHSVWVGANTEDEPFLGSYVKRKDFLKAVAETLGVAIYEVGHETEVVDPDPSGWIKFVPGDVGYHSA